MRQELTRQHLDDGLDRLETILFDEIYRMSVFNNDQGIIAQYSCNQRPIIICEVNPYRAEDILAFLRRVYIYIQSKENDQAMISNIESLAHCIKDWRINPGEWWRYKKGRMPIYYEAAYHAVQQSFPRMLTFRPEEIHTIPKLQLHRTLKELLKLKEKLKPGELILVRGIQGVYELARETIGEQLYYTEDRYCTSAPQTYQFRRDLETAIEMLK